MLTLEGCNGGQAEVEVRPECVFAVQSSRIALGAVPDPVAGAKTVLSLAQRPRTLAFEATRAVSRLRDEDAPVHLGNVGSHLLCSLQRSVEQGGIAVRWNRRDECGRSDP